MQIIYQIIKVRVYIAFVILFMFFTGCKKWVDVNYNPNDLSESSATPDVMLAEVLVNAGFSATDLTYSFWMGYYCSPTIQAGDVSVTYNLTPTASVDLPQPSRVLTLRFIDNKAQSLGQTFYSGIAKIIKAKVVAEDVDKFNNIPYRQSGDPLHSQFPEYDDAQFIYEDLMLVLDTAINQIKNADVEKNTSITDVDVVFHANKNKWIKFANTLKLRLLIHQAARPDRAAYIQEEINKIVEEGSGFLGSGENAGANPGFTDQKTSPFYGGYGFWEAGEAFARGFVGANVIAMNFLKATNDPRLGSFYNLPTLPLPPGAMEPFEQPEPSNYRGNVFGAPIDESMYPYQASTYISLLGGRTNHGPVTPSVSGIIKGYNMPSYILTSVESMFLQAEAIQRGWLPGDPKQAYLDAVRESFRWLNTGHNSNDLSLSDDVFNDWYTSESADGEINVSWDHAPDKYKLLMFQKYMALNGINGLESWTDYRRNGGYPNIPLSAHPNRIGTTMPVRLPYPSSEYRSNASHVNAQGDINIFTSKIWWMP